MLKLGLAVFAAMTIATSVARAAAEPAAVTPAQATFNAAETAFESDHWADAAAGFAQLIGPDDNAAPSHFQAVIRSRLAECYLRLDRIDEARASAKIALKGLAAADGDDFVGAWLTLADADRKALVMPEAIEAYRQVIALSQAPDAAETRRDAQRSLISAALVFDPAAAAHALDDLGADRAYIAGLSKSELAFLSDERGRSALNQGDAQSALKFFRQAIAESGGLYTSSINVEQADIRSDAAIATHLLRRDDDTHEFVSGSGAGHNGSEFWFFNANIEPLVCDPSRDVLPDDTAVIEFAIDRQGRVTDVLPVYASRPGRMGLEFARSVRDWRWSPDEVGKLNPFWRDAIRIQLRCIEKPTAVELSDDFFDATRTWLASKGVTAQDIAQLKTGSLSTEDPRLQRDDPTGIAAMIAAEQIPGWRAQNQTNEARLDTALDRAAAPPEVRALVIYLRWGHGLWRTAKFPSPHPSDAWEMFRAAEPNTRAAAWLTVEEAITFERFGDFKRARGLLQTVTEEPPTLLPADDRIRVLALLHEGLADARMGDAAAGQARIAEASLKPGACSLMDVKPLPTNLQIGSEYFPAEATRWGLSGYVKESFDIQADGRVKNVRTLLAYPPFIFEETTELAVGKFRYILPKINNDAVGCAGQTEGVSFVGF